ncbi:heme d1 biosynthesis radical SAM protein NirJ [Varunaivibrio sulfuroxidans]|uniref:Pre-heme d1 synthase n=1 Tax=Varunaivibrio sulfuroxidans TaxID=1773489 RepID=A0A4R3J8H1_9PROT|nr:heme d1 biosynthesis radical SAM protein NirJ [Varunaivibrio sulfuroxidans]TCS61792.1 heme d1 biosynthesis radical SAM protein NirJ [Varunaivibrio sulfuroxidans]WES32025.1 heme d1 biosynthesis radical SAM protein NirJ [Varunaivibrio sulfuroxidans]
MFRLSRFIDEVLNPRPLTPARPPSGPVVIWNLIRRCNLTCKHCYSISADKKFPGELFTGEIYKVMDNLWAFGVPVLILSGGEPLLRPDIFDISRRAKEMGFYVGLSTNGTLIDDEKIREIAAVGYNYVGISIDGVRETHDRFRRREGAYEASMRGLRLCRKMGIKVGVRFTMTTDNIDELPQLLTMMDDEGVDKFYLSHLNYAGRGNHNRMDDAHHVMTRRAMTTLFEACLDDRARGGKKEFVTGNNDADGPFLLMWVRERFPDRAEHIERLLRRWGGNASGVNVANIDNLGHVHPDTMWWHHNLGDVRERPFSDIWMDTRDPLMAGLKQSPRPVGGRCAGCRHLEICNGNTRTRAHQISGDPWAEDPGCYLSDEEIGVGGEGERMTVTPFSRHARARIVG